MSNKTQALFSLRRAKERGSQIANALRGDALRQAIEERLERREQAGAEWREKLASVLLAYRELSDVECRGVECMACGRALSGSRRRGFEQSKFKLTYCEVCLFEDLAPGFVNQR